MLIFAADIAPLPPEFQLGLISLVGVLALVAIILGVFRRHPPLDTDLATLRLAIQGLQKSVDALTSAEKLYAQHITEIANLQEKVKSLEARRELDQAAQRTYTRETTREIFERLEAINKSFATNVQNFERAMGRIEGAQAQIAQRLDSLET